MTRSCTPRRCLVVAALAASSLACGSSVAQDAGTERHFLWRVEGGSAPLLLLGSVHALPAEAYPLAQVIERAYLGAAVVAFETDLDGVEAAGGELLAAGTLPDGERLDAIVGPELYLEVAQRLEAAGMPPGALERSRPWLAALTLTTLEMARAGFAADRGVDLHFWRRAAQDGRRRLALETVEEQIALFTSLEGEDGVAFLRSTLEDLREVESLLDEVAEAWQSGRAEAVGKLLGEGMAEHPELMRRLVDDRNRAWLPRVVELARGREPALVVVGALHLVGDQGLVELLRAEGFTVTQQ